MRYTKERIKKLEHLINFYAGAMARCQPSSPHYEMYRLELDEKQLEYEEQVRFLKMRERGNEKHYL